MTFFSTISSYHMIAAISISYGLGSKDSDFYYYPGDERFYWLSSNRCIVGDIHSVLVRSSGHVGGNPTNTLIHSQRPALF